MKFSLPLPYKRAGHYSRSLEQTIKHQDENAVKKLLEATIGSANIKKKTYILSEALQQALQQDNKNIITMLIDHGADVNVAGPCRALCKAVDQSTDEILKILIEHGAQPNLPCEGFCTWKYPLYRAADLGKFSMVKFLIKNGADVNEGNPLRIACCRGREDIAKILVKHGAMLVKHESFARDDNALSRAVRYGQENMMSILLAAATTDQQQREVIYELAIDEVEGGYHSSSFDKAGHEQSLKLLIKSITQLKLDKRLLALILQKALAIESTEIISILLSTDMQVDYNWWCPGSLLMAVRIGHEEILKALLHGNHPDPAYNEDKSAALEAAFMSGNIKIVKDLLAANTVVNAANWGSRVLRYATRYGREEIVTMLILAGVSVDLQLSEAGNALCCAVEHDHQVILRHLLASTTDINALGCETGNSLHLAAAKGREEIVQILLDHGADIHVRNLRQEDSLHLAITQGHVNVVRTLINQGAQVNPAEADVDGSRLYWAISNRHKDIADMLIESGVDVNVSGGQFGNALQSAAAHGFEELVEYLIDKGALPNLQGGYYGNALQAASARNHKGIVELLIRYGASANAEGGQHSTALRAATSHKHDEIVELLISHGAEVNAIQDDFGNALLSATLAGSRSTVKILLKHGAIANINCKRNWYGSPLDTALALGYDGVVDILVKKGAKLQPSYGYVQA